MTDSGFHIPRSCVENFEGKTPECKLLSEYRSAEAYVLLGEQGSGKSESFKFEAVDTGGKYLKARDFINGFYGDITDKTLFIDGLDEIRSGNVDGRVPFDQVRKELIKLDNPLFRLSCREADWYGASDVESLKQITHNQNLNILRLQSFDDEEIERAIDYYVPTINKDWFLTGLKNNGLDSLLGNPQLLIMLAKACLGASVPDSRQQAYDLACRQMIEESNSEHQQGRGGLDFSIDEILCSAGNLCAHLLLADLDGYALTSGLSRLSYPVYSDIPCDTLPLARYTLKTRLFKQSGESEQREPVHRTVAEFLAANHIAQQIDESGLPIGRVLALMSSSEQIVPSLRGLYGWLAVLSRSERDNLLRRDPLGIVLYGDPKHLPKEQKVILIQGLEKEAKRNPRFRKENWAGYPFGALATQDMTDVFRKILSSSSRVQEYQALVDCVVDALEYGESFPSLSDELLALVKDKSWYSSIRRIALRILLRDAENLQADQVKSYIELTSSFRDGVIDDDNKDLLGVSLEKLYPEYIKPENIFDYLLNWKDDHYFGLYHNFWALKLIRKTSNRQLAILLDELASRAELRKQMEYEYSYQRMSGDLLIAGLRKHGDEISIERLYQWLSVGLDRYQNKLEQADQLAIADWISERPEKYKQLLILGSAHCKDKTDHQYRNCMYQVEMYLYGSRRPANFTQWLLKQAESSKDNCFSDYCFREVVRCFYTGTNPGMTLDKLQEWLNSHRKFKASYKEMAVYPIDDKHLDRTKTSAKRKQEDKKRKTEWILSLVKHKSDIANGEAFPSIFQNLGMAYFGYLHEANGETPIERLTNLFSEQPAMVRVALVGLTKVILRNDIPSPEEIFALHKESRRFYLEFAVLAGMQQLYIYQKEQLLELSDQQIESAITFYLVHASSSGGDWLNYYFQQRPDLSSSIFIEFAVHMLKFNQHHIYGSYACAYDESWAKIALLSCLEILKKFPLRSRAEQSSDLEHFLKAALRYANKKHLLNLICYKLGRKSLDDPQRSKWLAAALLLEPEKYEDIVDKFISKSSKRVLTLVNFFSNRRDQWSPEFNLPSSTISMLIRNIGVYVNPYLLSSGGRTVTREMNAAEIVGVLISKLAQSTDNSAVTQFEMLIRNGELNKWHLTLKDNLQDLTRRINEAAFIKPSLEGVINTLLNKAPANPADLMYLSLEILENQANKIRNNSANLFRQFWDKPDNKTEASPKIENDCRDILMAQIEPRFQQLGLQAIKEGYYVEDKRADLKIVYGNWNLPIEIKKDSYNKNAYDNVWTSLSNQLIKKYTRDPGALGYGIYLIFWFGQGKIRNSPEGGKPHSPEEMKQMIWKMMSADEQKYIGLCLVDCSLPEKLKQYGA